MPSTSTLLRAYLGGGMADLHAVHDWNKGFVRTSPAGQRYEAIGREIDRALAFMRACGVNDDEALRTVTLYCSHEALALEYERPLTRLKGQRVYGLSGHYLWFSAYHGHDFRHNQSRHSHVYNYRSRHVFRQRHECDIQ